MIGTNHLNFQDYFCIRTRVSPKASSQIDTTIAIGDVYRMDIKKWHRKSGDGMCETAVRPARPRIRYRFIVFSIFVLPTLNSRRLSLNLVEMNDKDV